MPNLHNHAGQCITESRKTPAHNLTIPRNPIHLESGISLTQTENDERGDAIGLRWRTQAWGIACPALYKDGVCGEFVIIT